MEKIQVDCCGKCPFLSYSEQYINSKNDGYFCSQKNIWLSDPNTGITPTHSIHSNCPLRNEPIMIEINIPQ